MSDCTILLKPIPSSTTKQTIRNIFRAYKLHRIHIEGDVAYVQFSDSSDLETLQMAFDNYQVQQLNFAKIDKPEGFDWNQIQNTQQLKSTQAKANHHKQDFSIDQTTIFELNDEENHKQQDPQLMLQKQNTNFAVQKLVQPKSLVQKNVHQDNVNNNEKKSEINKILLKEDPNSNKNTQIISAQEQLKRRRQSELIGKQLKAKLYARRQKCQIQEKLEKKDQKQYNKSKDSIIQQQRIKNNQHNTLSRISDQIVQEKQFEKKDESYKLLQKQQLSSQISQNRINTQIPNYLFTITLLVWVIYLSCQ